MDLREIVFHKEFHGVYSWSGSFGYFSETENGDVITRYASALRQGGRLLIDQPNREALLRHFVVTRSIGHRTIRNRWNAETERIESDWMVDRHGKKEHNRMSIRLYTPGQMKRLFEGVGFDVESMYGSRNGEPYPRSSQRLIVVGKK